MTALSAKVKAGFGASLLRGGFALDTSMETYKTIKHRVMSVAARGMLMMTNWRTVKMPATTEGLDRISEVLENYIENRKLYDPDGARQLTIDWINLRAEMLRAIVERDNDRD